MKLRLVRIGNSRGVRIPKAVLEQCQLDDEMDLEVRGRELILRARPAPRQGWEAAFSSMAAHHDDRLLDGGLGAQTRWDRDEWEW